MYNFILQVVVMVSLGTMVYILARAVPRVGERTNLSSPAKFLDEAIKKIPLEKIDAILSLLAEKSLRKIKIWILKTDNIVTNHLNKFKSRDKKQSSTPSIFENASTNQTSFSENNSSAPEDKNK